MTSLWDELDEQPTTQNSDVGSSLWDELDGTVQPEVVSDGTVQPEDTRDGTVQPEVVSDGTVQPEDTRDGTVQPEDTRDGTVQPEDTRDTMTPTEIDIIAEQQKSSYGMQIVAGARRGVTLPIAKVMEDSLGAIGIDIGNTSSKDLVKINNYIKNYEAKNPGQTIHPATLGNLASQLVVPFAKGVKGVAATEALLSSLQGIGKRVDYDDVIQDAAIGAVFGAVAFKTIQAITSKIGPISYEAKLLIDKHPELNEADVLKTLDGVPKADQAYALSNIVADDFVGFTKQSVKPSTTDKLLLKQQLAGRTEVARREIGKVDNQVVEAKQIYADMVEEVASKSDNSVSFKDMIPKLDNLITRYDKTPSRALSIVNNMKSDLEAGKGFMNTSTALQFRKDLNYLINKAKRTEEKALLNNIKGNVDGFLTKNLDEQTLFTLDNAITNYSRAMNNRDFIELMDKYVSKEATDWVGLSKSLKKENLSSPEVDNAIKIVKEFSEKFKNDAQLRSATKVEGQPEDPGGMLGLISYAINKTRDTLIPFGKRARELDIQKAILKSIRTAKNPLEVFQKMEVNKVPPKLVKDLQESLLIEYKPGAKLTGDVGLETRYASQAGTVANNPTDVNMFEATTELLQKELGRDKGSAVTTKLDELGFFKENFVRYEGVLKSISSKMSVVDKSSNMKAVTASIKSEAKIAADEIEKTLGIKLSDQSMDRIVHRKLTEIIKSVDSK